MLHFRILREFMYWTYAHRRSCLYPLVVVLSLSLIALLVNGSVITRSLCLSERLSSSENIQYSGDYYNRYKSGFFYREFIDHNAEELLITVFDRFGYHFIGDRCGEFRGLFFVDNNAELLVSAYEQLLIDRFTHQYTPRVLWERAVLIRKGVFLKPSHFENIYKIIQIGYTPISKIRVAVFPWVFYIIIFVEIYGMALFFVFRVLRKNAG